MEEDEINSPTKDDEECFWEEGLEDYNPPEIYGSELDSLPASAAKVYFERPLGEEKLSKRMEDNKVPSNCTFLATKRCNPEIFQLVSGNAKHLEKALQDALSIQSAASTTLLKAASLLSGEARKVKLEKK